MARTKPKAPRKIVRKSTTGGVTNSVIVTWFRDFVSVQGERKRFAAREEEIKKRLKDAVEDRGYEDSDGHYWFDLPEEIGGYSKIKKEKRVSLSLDEERALELLRSKDPKLAQKCVKTVEVFDKEAFEALAYEHLSDAEQRSLITKNVTWALVPRK